MPEVYYNNAFTQLTADVAAADLSINVQSSAPFTPLAAGDWFRCSMWNEVIKVTDIVGTVWTIERELEGVALANTPTGTAVIHQPTAGMFTDLPPGPTGPTGPTGTDGVGVPAGGTTAEVLAKASNSDYDTEWVPQSGSGGGSSVVPVITVDSSDEGATGIIHVSIQIQDGSGGDVSGRFFVTFYCSDASYGAVNTIPLDLGVSPTTGVLVWTDSANRIIRCMTDATGLLVIDCGSSVARTVYAIGVAGSITDIGTMVFTSHISPFNINVEAQTHLAASIDPWSDGAFPSDVQPAPLWGTGQTPAWINLVVAGTGVFNVTGDLARNSNIGKIGIYDQDTDTSAGSPAGSLNTLVDCNNPSPAGFTGVSMGTITFGATGTRRIWLGFADFSYHSVKTLYFTP